MGMLLIKSGDLGNFSNFNNFKIFSTTLVGVVLNELYHQNN